MFFVKCFLPTTSRAEKKTFVMYSQKFPNIGTHYRQQNHENSTANLSVSNANLAQFEFDVYDSDRPEICVRRQASNNETFSRVFRLCACGLFAFILFTVSLLASGRCSLSIIVANFGIFLHCTLRLFEAQDDHDGQNKGRNYWKAFWLTPECFS